MNIINEFFVSFILIKLYFKFKVCRKIKFPLLWKFYFSKWKFYFSADIILNEKVYRNLDQIEEKIDTLILFRKGEVALEILPKLVEKNIKNLWLQLGISNETAKEECKKLDINFIQNRCIMLEYPYFKTKEK